MRVILSNLIEIQEPTREILDFCKKELTIKNPDYDKKMRMGFYVGRMPKFIKLYDVHNDNVYMPIGCFSSIWELHPIKKDYTDYSVTNYRNITSNMTLREYQKPCVDALKKYVNGIFILPAG